MEELTLDALIERIQSGDPNVRTDAWLSAGAVGAAGIKPLAKIVVDKEAEVKQLQEQGKKQELAQPLEVGRAAKHAMWKIVRTVGAPGKDAARAAVEAELIDLLGEAQPDSIRREVLWMLSEIGGEATLQAVRDIPNILENKAIREDARCCVERIPGEAAIRALADGLEYAPDDFKLAMAQSLRARGVEVDPVKYPCQKLVPTRKTNVQPVSQ